MPPPPLFALFALISLSRLLSSHSQPNPPPKATRINCGALESTVIEGYEWLPDGAYVVAGTPKSVRVPGLLPLLSTVRSFPRDGNAHSKFCYMVPVYRGARYLVRSTYFYGEVNDCHTPPVFDQIIDGTVWSEVNTTEDYANGMSSYYEGVFLAKGKFMSFCLAPNARTDSDPFVSALEFVLLADSLYNSTDFEQFGLRLIQRSSFGYTGTLIQYPDDPFDRFWSSFGRNGSTATNNTSVAISGLWNLPPLKVFQTELTAPELNWPLVYLPSSMYYIALYFADDRNSSTESSRKLHISINGVTYYRDLTVTPAGVAVFATRWPLAGFTKITMTPASGSDLGPLINAGEVFQVLPLGGRTLTRDIIALEKVKQSFQNNPLDWSGDPCFPRQYAWTGVTCSEGPRIRVTALNLTSMRLSGSLSDSIANLTALTGIWLGNNSLSGSIPDFSSLKKLEILHLEENQLSGELPASLGELPSLRELFLQSNKLTGQVPDSLLRKPGLNLKVDPGSNYVVPPVS